MVGKNLTTTSQSMSKAILTSTPFVASINFTMDLLVLISKKGDRHSRLLSIPCPIDRKVLLADKKNIECDQEEILAHLHLEVQAPRCSLMEVHEDFASPSRLLRCLKKGSREIWAGAITNQTRSSLLYQENKKSHLKVMHVHIHQTSQREMC